MPDQATSPSKDEQEKKSLLAPNRDIRASIGGQHHAWGDQHCLISCKCPCHTHEDAVEHVHHGWVWKKSHAEKWHCGLPIRVAVLSYSCILMLALAGRVYALFKDESVIPWFTIPLICAIILCCWLGLWRRSPNFMLIAAILSGVLFTDTIVTFFLKWPFQKGNDGKTDHAALILNAVGLIFQCFLALMNIFACISYRNHLVSLHEFEDYHATHFHTLGTRPVTSPGGTQHIAPNDDEEDPDHPAVHEQHILV